MGNPNEVIDTKKTPASIAILYFIITLVASMLVWIVGGAILSALFSMFLTPLLGIEISLKSAVGIMIIVNFLFIQQTISIVSSSDEFKNSKVSPAALPFLIMLSFLLMYLIAIVANAFL